MKEELSMKFNELNMKMIVPPASVGILVVASGICLFLFNSFCRGKTATDKREKKVPVDDSRCACCLKPFIIGRGVRCNDCSARFCRKGCGRWEVEDNVWICLFCYHRRTWLKKKEKWFDKFGGTHSIEDSNGHFSTAKSQVYVAGVEHATISPGVDLAASDYKEMDSVENIRGVIEKIVESLVGNVDDAPIDRLYQHPSYDRLFEDFGVRLAGALRICTANKPTADTPSMAHTALRELVERAVDEARKLPGLGDSVSTRRQDNASISEQNYEDLLAAAILNKVVEKYQKGRVDGNSNVVHETTSRRCRHSGSEMSANGDEGSSLDPMSQDECGSECSRTKTKLCVHQEPLSLTIEEQIEEVTTTYTSDEETRNVKANALNFRNTKRVPFPEYGMDIVDPSQESSDSEDDVDTCASVDHITPLETWEENWLFQRKKIATQPEPVAMLVPNPSEDYRALIGDKDADDMSDLSEFSGQSDEEVDEKFVEAINQVLPESPKILQYHLGEDSAILHDDFTSEIVCENLNDVEKSSKTIHGSKIELDIVKKDSLASPADDAIKINGTEIEAVGGNPPLSGVNTRKNGNFKGEERNNNDIPRTPSATPIRHSLCESDPALPITCDLQTLNEKLIAIDDSSDDDVVDHFEQSPESERQFELESSKQFIHGILNVEENGKEEILENGKIFNNDTACREAKAAAKAKSTSSIETKSNGEGRELSAPPRPGTIAEREHKKWENAAPIENNPYSEENIQKRLLERQYARRSSDCPGTGVLPSSPSPPLKIVLGGNRPDVQRFSRDYYINGAKSPTGERKSRPSSSLSQNSTSTSSDYEHQESFEPIETESQEVTEEILERERKNSKNEVNAKLNNRGNFESSMFDSKKSLTDENNKKIRRIDLRAYGFTNQFNDNNENRKKQPRVVNKLDLRSYGYDSGLQRTQSHNHIDSKVNNSFINSKLKNDRNVKSNLTQNRARLDYIWTQSTEDLNKGKEIIFDQLGGMTTAKSVPNIANISSFRYNGNRKNSDGDVEIHGKEVNCSGDNGLDYDSDSQNSKTESAEEFPRKLLTSKEMKYSLESLEGPDRFIDAALPMPSVKRLAEAFNTPPEVKPTPVPRTNKPLGGVKDRPTTPEIHIVKTPRQMHSLTARSLSREFREGLRQISCKPNAQPVYSTIIEHSKVSAGSPISSVSEDNDNTHVIPPGNLRNNIQFWEQLQRKL